MDGTVLSGAVVCSRCGKEWRIGRRCCHTSYAVTHAEFVMLRTLREIRALPTVQRTA